MNCKNCNRLIISGDIFMKMKIDILIPDGFVHSEEKFYLCDMFPIFKNIKYDKTDKRSSCSNRSKVKINLRIRLYK